MVLKTDTKVIADALVDIVAIVGLTTLAAMHIVPAETIVPVIILIAGASVGAKLPRKDSGSGGNSIPPGTSSIVLAIGAAGLRALQSTGKAIIPLGFMMLAAMLSGCGGAGATTWKLVRGACEVIVGVHDDGTVEASEHVDGGTQTIPVVDLQPNGSTPITDTE